MSEIQKKRSNKLQRTVRSRAKLDGTAAKPRMSVHISNQHVSVQLIDDVAMKTLVNATSLTLKDTTKLTMTQKAEKVGSEIGKKAKSLKIIEVIFDRGGSKYHGRVKALADAARQEGLKF